MTTDKLYDEIKQYFGFMEDGRKSYITGLLSQSKADWCRQQRKKCADAFCSEQDTVDYPEKYKEHAEAANDIRNEILNAPEPD